MSIYDTDELSMLLDKWRDSQFDGIIERRRSGKIRDIDEEFKERHATVNLHRKMMDLIHRSRKDLYVVGEMLGIPGGWKRDADHQVIIDATRPRAMTVVRCGRERLDHPIVIDWDPLDLFLRGAVCSKCGRRIRVRLYYIVESVKQMEVRK